MRLSIHPPCGQIRLTIPRHMPWSEVVDFVTQKKNWILQQQARWQKQGDSLGQVRLYEHGTSFPYLGKHITVHIEAHPRPYVSHHDEKVIAYLPADHTPNMRINLMENWLKDRMRAYVDHILPMYEAKIGVRAGRVVLRRMKSRWGSCQPQTGRICLNLELMTKPEPCLHYVLVHELVHLLEPNHNQRFYAWMDWFMSDWKETRRLLNGK